MNPHLYDDVLRDIISAADGGDNPLDLVDPVVRTDEVEEVVYAALSGLSASASQRVAASLKALEATQRRVVGNPQGLPDLDLVTAQLLVHMEIDPLMVAWMGRICGGFTLYDDDTMDPVVSIDGFLHPQDSMCSSHVEMGEAQWRSTGSLVVPGLPDSTLVAAVGRPLSEIASHPVLDLHPLVVTGCITEDRMSNATLSTDIRHRLLRADDLLSLAPCGCR